MQLNFSEFLATVPELTHEQARTAARDYAPLPYLHRIEGPVRKTQVETGFIINGTEERLKAMLDDPTASETQKMLAAKILNAMSKLYKVEFYINLADLEVAGMFSLAHSLEVLNNDEVGRITEAGMYIPAKPFPNTTLYDVLIGRNVCPVASVNQVGGYLTFTTSEETEQHYARVWGVNPRTQRQTVLGNIRIDTAGVYEFKLPTHYLDFTDFAVDNPYGVI